MVKPFDGVMPGADQLIGKAVPELLLLIGDEEKGLKFEAMDLILKLEACVVFPFLEAAVRDDHQADMRNAAMEVLVALGKEAVPQLIELLRDPDEEVRNFSAVMLGDIGNRDGVSPLINALQDPDANVRHGAAEALGKIGDSGALAALMELLKEDFWLQYPAIVALGEMADKRAVPHLLKLLDRELLVTPVIEALGKIGDTRALPAVCTVLGTHPDNVVAGSAARAIVAVCTKLFPEGDRLTDDLYELQLQHLIQAKGVLKLKQLLRKGDSSETVCAAAIVLGWLQHETSLPDLYELAQYDDYFEAMEQAILSIGKMAIPYSLAALSLPTARVKAIAVRVIGQFGEPSNIKKLFPLLLDASEDVQKQTLEMLKRFHDDEMLPRLFEMVEAGEEDVSLLASEVLGGYASLKVHKFLQKLALSADPVARKRAAILLRYSRNGFPNQILARLAGDEVAAVRKEVARALGCNLLPGGIDLLRAALSDPDEGVRVEAVLSMAELGDHTLLQELLELLPLASEEIVCAVVRAVGRNGAEAGGNPLLELLGGESISQRVEFSIIETFAMLGYKPASSILTERYLNHHDVDLRRLALKALGSIGDAASLKAVACSCNDPHWSVRIAALQTLLQVGGEESLPVLFSALSDPDYMVRKNTIAALGGSGYHEAIPKLVQQLLDPEMARYAFEALLNVGRRGLISLHRMLRNEKSHDVRVRLIDIVGRTGDRMSIGVLMDLLEDPAASIRVAAIDALLSCFDGSLLKKLSRLKSFDPSIEVQEKADLALRTLTSENFF